MDQRKYRLSALGLMLTAAVTIAGFQAVPVMGKSAKYTEAEVRARYTDATAEQVVSVTDPGSGSDDVPSADFNVLAGERYHIRLQYRQGEIKDSSAEVQTTAGFVSEDLPDDAALVNPDSLSATAVTYSDETVLVGTAPEEGDGPVTITLQLPVRDFSGDAALPEAAEESEKTLKKMDQKADERVDTYLTDQQNQDNSADDSANDSADDSANDSVNDSANDSADDSANDSLNDSANDFVNDSAEGSATEDVLANLPDGYHVMTFQVVLTPTTQDALDEAQAAAEASRAAESSAAEASRQESIAAESSAAEASRQESIAAESSAAEASRQESAAEASRQESAAEASRQAAQQTAQPTTAVKPSTAAPTSPAAQTTAESKQPASQAAETVNTATYTVRHFLMRASGKYSDKPYLEETFEGTAGETVKPEVKEYKGFISPKPAEVTIAADGSTVVNYQYERMQYKFRLGEAAGISTEGSTPSGKYYWGTRITLKASAQKGYRFTGWSDGSTENEITVKMPKGKLEISPAAEEVTYKVKFNLDGGTGVKNLTYTISSDDISLGTPTKEGYYFVGWTGSNGDQPDPSVTIPKGSTGNKKYKANWEAGTGVKYTVRHFKQNADGSYPSDPTAVDTLYGTTDQKVTPEVREYTGYASPKAQTVTIAADGSTVVDYQYPLNRYHFTLKSVEGISTNGSSPTGDYLYNEEITLKATAEAGYTFTGWSTGEKAADVTIRMPAEDLTVSATADRSDYTVTFNSDGGSKVETQTVQAGEKAIRPKDPTKDNASFTGWYNGNSSTPYNFNDPVSSDLSLTAHWENTSYSITAKSSTWTQGTGAGLSFETDIPYERYRTVSVDDGIIATADYSAWTDSSGKKTEMTLQPSFLQTLSVGSHTLTVTAQDGSAAATFDVAAAAAESSTAAPVTTQAQTGKEESHSGSHLGLILFFVGIIVAVGAAAALLILTLRRKAAPDTDAHGGYGQDDDYDDYDDTGYSGDEYQRDRDAGSQAGRESREGRYSGHDRGEDQ